VYGLQFRARYNNQRERGEAIAAPFLPAGREREKENTSRASLSKPLPNHF